MMESAKLAAMYIVSAFCISLADLQRTFDAYSINYVRSRSLDRSLDQIVRDHA